MGAPHSCAKPALVLKRISIFAVLYITSFAGLALADSISDTKTQPQIPQLQGIELNHSSNQSQSLEHSELARGVSNDDWFGIKAQIAASRYRADPDKNDGDDTGASYPLAIDTSFEQQAYLKASNTGIGDEFGYSVAISGDTIVIGALLEDSNATGVNGDQGDNSARVSGASYVFFITREFLINAGLNDAWVHDDAPFQGFFFSIFPKLKFFFLSWFTFDSVPPDEGVIAVFGARDHRWVTAGGFYEGDTVTLNVELTSGGIFNSSDPLADQEAGYGTITVIFISCSEARLIYDFPSIGPSGEMILNRVLPDNVEFCELLSGPQL
jgi:hypothetical protein